MRIRLASAASAALLLALLLPGCSSMPVPRREGDALLIILAANPTDRNQTAEWDDIVTLRGPTELALRTGTDRRRLLLERVRPGTYAFAGRAIRWREGDRPVETPQVEPLEIGPGTINLCPVKLLRWADERGGARTGVRPVTPDDQRMVTAEISDYLNFGEWIGSGFVGFGPYRPRFSLEKDAYRYRIASRPEGARVRIDGQDWGTTPLDADLTPGRHQLVLEKEGFAVTRTYVTVESEGEVEAPLAALAGSQEAARSDRGRLALAPFRNLGPPQDEAIGAVFDDTLEVSIAAGSDSLEPVRASAAAAAPDFGEAERAGADLLAVGSYLLDDERLLVQAALYDVPSRMTRGATTYSGPSGLAMFAGIDALVEELLTGARRDLPQPGQPVIRASDPLLSVAYDRKRTENEVIAKRLERRTSIAVHGYLGGEFDTIDDPPAFENDMRLQTDGPALGLGVTYERQIRGPFSLALVTNPLVSPSDNAGLIWELPLYAGARYSFLGYRTDLYWGLYGEARFVGPMTVTQDEAGVESDYDYGPYLIGGLTFDTGLKLYTYDRISRPARFVNLGMMIGVLGARATLDFSEIERVPIALWLYCGFGGRL